MSDALDALQANYFNLTENLDNYLDKCQSDEQRKALKAAYQQARTDFYNARNKAFAANDADVEKTVSELEAAQDSLQKMTQELANIAKIINGVTTAVKIAGQLASMGK